MDKPVMNSKFYEVNLQKLIANLGEDNVKKILSSFECPKNQDVETFLRYKAIEFSKQNIAKTHLVFWKPDKNIFSQQNPNGDKAEFVGYYSIAPKYITVSKDKSGLSQSQWKRIIKFGTHDKSENVCRIPAPLIGQLGKNFANGNNYLISGKDLLILALNKIEKVQMETGGKLTYVECENKEKLLGFYKKNGFIAFGTRELDRDETEVSGEFLVQLYKYL